MLKNEKSGSEASSEETGLNASPKVGQDQVPEELPFSVGIPHPLETVRILVSVTSGGPECLQGTCS